jgi:HlyD family secretion protein
MDIPRKKSKFLGRRARNIIYTVLGLSALTLITLGVSRLKPAAPTVERGNYLIDTVKRGPMLRQVRGTGSLQAEDIRVIAASTQGRVERINILPGTSVTPGSVLIELSNPELQQSAVDTEYQLKAAQADLNNLRVKLESDHMTQEAAAASVHSEYQQAKLQSDTDEALDKDGLIPAINLKLSRVKVAELSNRYNLEKKRLDVSTKAAEAQMASQQARISQLQALLELKRAQVTALHVAAGTTGVLQQMQVEVGQEVTPGTNLARVVEPQHLKAVLKIAETQVKDITEGQRAEVDTRNGIIPGHVSRIDPAAQQGTFTVDVALEGELPQAARPDLTVDGTIELERLTDVVYVGRPAFGQAQSTVKMFKLEEGGKSAVLVPVKFGRSSVNSIEIVDGLKPGDQVILSDTSSLDGVNRILLN